MDRRQYFIEAMQAEKFKSKDWIISVFAVNRYDPDLQKTSKGQEWLADPDPVYNIVHNPADKEGVYFIDPNNGNQMTKIDGAHSELPVFGVKDRIDLNPGDLPNVFEKIDTTYGNALINCIILVWPFKDKFPFVTGRINGFALEARIAARLKDTPEAGAERDPAFVYVDEFLLYCEAMSSLAGISEIYVPAASPKSMVIDHAVIKRRDELLEQYKEQLHDPAIVAKIDAELAALDRSMFKGDDAEGFYIKGKSFDVSRKRAFVMVGIESGFGDTRNGVNPITKSLEEGWDIERMPDMVDSLRSGIYNRGSQTALGGESVKYFYRIFQNTRVAEDDCGTKSGIPRTVTKDNWKTFVGLHLAAQQQRDGQSAHPDVTRLTEEKLQLLIGKTIITRSPMMCKTEGASFCALCVGDTLAKLKTGLHIAAADVGSIFMLLFMKAMHGKALRTAVYDPVRSIT